MILPQLMANGLATGCLYALTATGLSLIYNTAKVFHFAHGAIYTAGGYLCYVFLVGLGWPLALATSAALALAAGLGALTETAVYSPLARRRASPLVALLSSLGLYVALVNTIALFFGNETKVLRPGVDLTLQMGPVILTRIQVAQLLVGFLLLSGLLVFIRMTQWGRMICAVRDNPTLSTVMGVNPSAVRLLVFVLGSALAGVAAILSALDVGMAPHVGMPALLNAAVALIVGGVRKFEGAVVGGLLLGLLQSLIIWQVSARWTEAVSFALLILTLLLRPEGLLGERRRLEEAIT